MNETQTGRVQRLAPKTERVERCTVAALPARIDRITEQRMPHRRHVHAHLMCAPGFEPTVKSDPGPAFMAALRDRLKTAYALELAD